MLGQHLELGWYRGEFLRARGYEVVFPESRKKAVAAIQGGKFDVVILSYSLSHKTTQELLELVDQKCPECPVIAITEKRWEDRHLNPVETVLLNEGPTRAAGCLEESRWSGQRFTQSEVAQIFVSAS
jgi:CheY-like chemotaxis protein